jgi:hypothetical protein
MGLEVKMNFTARETQQLLHKSVEAISVAGVKPGMKGEIVDARKIGSWILGIKWSDQKFDWLTKREFVSKVKILK